MIHERLDACSGKQDKKTEQELIFHSVKTFGNTYSDIQLSSFSLEKYGYLPTKALILVTNEQQKHKCYCTNTLSSNY